MDAGRVCNARRSAARSGRWKSSIFGGLVVKCVGRSFPEPARARDDAAEGRASSLRNRHAGRRGRVIIPGPRASSTGRRCMALFIRRLPEGRDLRDRRRVSNSSKLSHLVNQRSTRQSGADWPLRPGLRSASRFCSKVSHDMLPISIGEACVDRSPALLHRLCFQPRGRRRHRPGEKSTARSMEIL